MKYFTVLLQAAHKKKDFDCGNPSLNRYLHEQAKQDMKRMLSACFVLEGGKKEVKGYFTLSNASVNKEMIPDDIKTKMPPAYLSLPATLLGRLAVDKNYKRQGLGELLLLDALKRSYDHSITSVGSMCVIVDPIDQGAESFYTKYGFIKLTDSGKMFLPMATIASVFIKPYA